MKWRGLDTSPSELWLSSQWDQSVFLHLTSKSAIRISLLYCEVLVAFPNCKYLGREKVICVSCVLSWQIICVFSESCSCSCWGTDGNNKDWFSRVTNTPLYIHKGRVQLAIHVCLYLTSWKVCGFNVNQFSNSLHWKIICLEASKHQWWRCASLAN